jgi:hypothetical protein
MEWIGLGKVLIALGIGTRAMVACGRFEWFI